MEKRKRVFKSWYMLWLMPIILLMAGNLVHAEESVTEPEQAPEVIAEEGEDETTEDATLLMAIEADVLSDVRNGEVNQNGKWYLYDNGMLVTGWHDFDTKRVCYAETGEMLYGLQIIEGEGYYLNPQTGAVTSGEVYFQGHWYCFDEEGKMITGWHDFDTKRVYYAATGEMLYGLQIIDGQGYCFDEQTGGIVNGERHVNGSWRYFDEEGKMVTGWKDLGNKTVYYDENGAMVYGVRTIDGITYGFHSKTGAKTVGELYWNGNWYCFDEEGKMRTGWYEFPNKKVYYQETGEMVHGEYFLDDNWYFFDLQTGGMSVGIVYYGGVSKYYGAAGERQYGEKNICGHWYYFYPDTGIMAIGLTQLPNKMVCYGKNGAMVYGEAYADGHWRYFSPGTGEMVTGLVNLNSKTVYYDENGAMVYGKLVIDGCTYYMAHGTGAMTKNGWGKMDDNLWYYFGANGVLDCLRLPQTDFLGTCRGKIVQELAAHEYDYYYIGTPLKGLTTNSPNYSMISYPNGAPRWDGYSGFNCTGFVAYVYEKCGANLQPIGAQGLRGSYYNASNWFRYAKANLTYYQFSSPAALLASGKAQKGDIIYMEPDWGWSGADCHITIFWGNTPSENKIWHSMMPYNQISEIRAGTRQKYYYLIKTSN